MNKSILEIKLQAAIDEIVTAAQYALYKDVIETWLSDYKELWDELRHDFDLPPLEMIHGRIRCEFDSIYRHLTELIEYYRIEAVCGVAMDEYHAILLANAEARDDLKLPQWIRKYEQIGTTDLLMPPIEDGDVNNVRTIYDVTYLVAGSEFKKSMDFYPVFSRLFWVEKLLPASIAEIDRQQEQQMINHLEEHQNEITDNSALLCDECKPLGYCKNNPPTK